MENKNILSEVSRMKSLFGYQRGVVISEQTQQLTPAQMAALNQGFGPLNAQAADLLVKQGKVKLNTLPFTTQTNLANNPVTPRANVDPNADYFKNPDGTVQVKELPAVTVTAKKKAQQQKTATPVKFVPEKFPLKYMMQGENVKKLQQALNVVDKEGKANISGKFYNATQTALDAKAKELGLKYDRNVGLDQESFNQIIQASQPQKQLAKVEPVATKTTADIKAVQPPTTLTPKAPQIQAPKTELTLDQQFQMAKANLQAAKQELDNAQKTRDRAAIGAARGKQQAARQEVQRLRNELANQGA